MRDVKHALIILTLAMSCTTMQNSVGGRETSVQETVSECPAPVWPSVYVVHQMKLMNDETVDRWFEAIVTLNRDLEAR